MVPFSSGNSERSAAAIDWRYVRHPHSGFKFALLERGGSTSAVLVFEETSLAGTLIVYDLAAATARDLRELVAQLILHALSQPQLTAVRVLLDTRHPARSALRRLGFVPRA